MNISAFFKNVEKFTVDNSPAILTAVGVVGTLSSVYLTGKATIKAVQLVDVEAAKAWNEPSVEFEGFDRKEIVQLVWKLYLPAAVTTTFTIAAIVGSAHVSARRATAMATAYTLTERAFVEYKDKVVEKIGEKKEQEVRDEIAEDRMREDPVSDKTVYITSNGDVLCYDKFTGRYFESNMETIRAAENEINRIILNDGYASLSDLYYELGLKPTAFSDEVGWGQGKHLKINYSTVMSDDNRPCIAIDFDLEPNRGFSSFAEG